MAPPSFSSTRPTHLLFPMTRLATLSLALYHYLALFVCLQTKTTFCLFAYSEMCISLPLMYPAVIHIFVSVARLMVCCRYDSPPQTPHCCPSGCCGGGTFLPLRLSKKPSLEKQAYPASRLLMFRWRVREGSLSLLRVLQSDSVFIILKLFITWSAASGNIRSSCFV